MSKKSKRKIDLRSAVLVLLLLLILLITSTYAWFTANRVVSISSIDVHIEAQNGLQISADGVNWKTVLSVDDLKTGYTVGETADTNQIPANMEPVSSAGEVVSGKMNMYYGTVSGDAQGDWALTATKETTETKGTEGKYVAFDVFLKVDKETSIALGANSKVVFKQDKEDRGLQNAARVAFLQEGNSAENDGQAAFVAQNGAISYGEENSTTYIWEPNQDVHTTSAVRFAKETYNITTSETSAAAIPYSGIKAPIASSIKLPKTNATDNADYFKAITPTYKTNAVMAQVDDAFTLDAGVTKMRIYMWIEGQDVDCENSASGSDVSFLVEFIAAEDQAEA